MVQIGLLRMIEIGVGISTAGPMFFMAFHMLSEGDLLFAGIFTIAGCFLFFLPGLVIQHFYQDIMAAKNQKIEAIKRKIDELIPLISILKR